MWPKILKIVEPSVEELLIRDPYRTKEAPTAATSWKFPRLEMLDCIVGYHNIFKYFVGVTSLIAFSWYQPTEVQPFSTDTQTILRNNQNLIEMRGKTGWAFFDNLGEINFRLEALDVWILSEGVPTAPFISFLKSQAPTLVLLRVDLVANQEILELIFTMPRLAELTSNLFIHGDLLVLPENTTITTYEVDGIGQQFTLIRAMRGLKHLKCAAIGDATLAFLAEAAPGLVSLTTDYFNVSRIPAGRAFPKMKKLGISEVYEGYKTPNSKFAKLVKKEVTRVLKVR